MRLVVWLMCVVIGAASIRAGEKRKPTRAETAREALRRAEPAGLRWTHSQRIDLNCDGTSDEVFTASDESRFYVAAVLGPITAKSRFSVVAFRLSGDSQDSFCDAFESLTPEDGERCKGLKLIAGECDSFHLYWDHDSNALDWWRL